MKFIDTHSHLFSEEFSDDLPLIIERAKEIGISKVFMPNIDSSSIEPMLKVAKLYPDYCYSMLGLHPTSVKENYKEELKQIEGYLKHIDLFIAIGEVGIDLYWDKTFQKEQMQVFEKQIEWSIEYSLPLVIHSRESFPEIVAVLDNYREEPIKGIFHSFGGSLEEANRLLEFENFFLGINGVVTFKKSSLPEVLKSISLERIVLETDSPYLTPMPYRGKRNESSYLKYVLQKVSRIYGKSEQEIAQKTNENILKIFKIVEG